MTTSKTEDGPDAPENNYNALARFIFDMRYEDLRDLGRNLHEMTQSDDGKDLWDLTKEDQWAELLFCWAEANVREDD